MNAAKQKFVVVGPTAMDVKAYTHEKLGPGVTSFGDIAITPGGPARNIAENLARLGSPTTLLSVVGDDITGQLVLDHARTAGIDVSYVQAVSNRRTSVYASFSQDRDAEPYIIYNRDVVGSMSVNYLHHRESVLRAATCYILHTDPYSMDAFTGARAHNLINKGVPVGLSIKPTEIEHLRTRVPFATWVFMNGDEAHLLTGQPSTSAQDAARVIRDIRGFRTEVTAITLGADGLVLDTGDRICWVHGNRVVNADATGAGDSFIAGFAHQFMETRDPVEAAIYGSAVAALTVDSPDTVRPDLSDEKVQSYLRAHPFEVVSL